MIPSVIPPPLSAGSKTNCSTHEPPSVITGHHRPVGVTHRGLDHGDRKSLSFIVPTEIANPAIHLGSARGILYQMEGHTGGAYLDLNTPFAPGEVIRGGKIWVQKPVYLDLTVHDENQNPITGLLNLDLEVDQSNEKKQFKNARPSARGTFKLGPLSPTKIYNFTISKSKYQAPRNARVKKAIS